MKDGKLNIIVQIDTEILAAQISEQIVMSASGGPHYVTKKQCMESLGWSEYHLKAGETSGFLRPLRLAGKGEIRYSFTELTDYHNHLQNDTIKIHPNSDKKARSSSRNAIARRKRS